MKEHLVKEMKEDNDQKKEKEIEYVKILAAKVKEIIEDEFDIDKGADGGDDNVGGDDRGDVITFIIITSFFYFTNFFFMQ